MLRPIRCPYIGPRIIPLTVTTSRAGVTIDRGVNDLASATSAGAGLATLNLRRGFQRIPGAFVTPWSTVGDGAIGGLNAASDIDTLTTEISDNAGTGTDGKADVLVMGFDSQHTFGVTSRYKPHHNIHGALTNLRLLSFNISRGVLVTGSEQATLVNTVVGTYTLTFKHPFVQAPFVFGTVVNTTAGVVNVHASSATAVTVKVWDDAGGANDYEVNLYILGQDSGDTSGGHSRVVNVPYRKAVMYPVGITVDTGVPSLVAGIGSELFTLTDSGPGIYTLDYTAAAKGRAGEIIAIADTDNIATVSGITTSGFVIRTFTHAGVAADCTTCAAVALFFDDDDTFS